MALLVFAVSIVAADDPDRVKWHPGHYAFVQFNALREEHIYKSFRGVQKTYTWRALEPEKDRYDFSAIRADLAFLAKHDKRLVVQVQTKTFGAGQNYCPSYITGVYRTRWGSFNPIIWDEQVNRRLNALYNRLGKELDREPFLEAVVIPESATTFDVAARDKLRYTTEKYTHSVEDGMQAIKDAFPTTVVIQYVNMPPESIQPLADYAKKHGVGFGGPDIYPYDPVLTNPQRGVYRLYAPLSGIVPLGAAVQQNDYTQKAAFRGPDGETPVKEIYEFGRDKLRLNYIFWGTRPGYFEKVQAMLATPSFPKDPAGGLNATRPQSVGDRIRTQPQPGTSTFRVRPETTFQTMVGFGAGFYPGSVQNINAIKKPEDRARVYDLLYGDKGVRLNIVRLTISPNAQPLAGDHRYDWAADDNMQSTWKSIQPVLRKTKPIIYAVPFTPPPRWKDNGQPTKGGALKHEHYQDYAEYLADFLEYYHKTLHVDIDVLSLQNEPGIVAPWDSCIWTGEELRDFLKILAPMVRARGLKTQFMLSEGTAWTGAWDHLLPTLQDSDAHRFLNIMASHSYGSPEDKARKEFAAASAKNGLPVWMSEMSLMFPPAPDDPGMNAAIQTARYLHHDLVEAHACVWIYCFAIFTSTFQGSMGVLSPADGEGPLQGSLVVPKRFWAMANYSHFVRPGWKLMQIDGVGFANTGFVSPKGDSFVIVALNPNTKPQPTTYDFGDRTISAVEAFVTTADLDLARVPPPATQPHRFSATLPPMSVTTFVGTLGHCAEPTSSSVISLTLGPARQLLQAGQLDMSFMPDQHMAVLQQPDKSYRIFTAGFFGGMSGKDSTGILTTKDFLTYQPGVGTATKAQPVLRPTGNAEDFDADYAGANFVFTATNHNDLLMIYHGETRTFGNTRKPDPPFPFYAQVGLARSSDNGLTWKRLGPIISGSDPKPSVIPKTFQTGVPEPGAIIAGDYIYVFYPYFPTPGCPDAGPPTIQVARAPVSSDGAPGSWTKYYNGSFGSQPGLGGLGSPIVPAASGCAEPQQPWVAYSSYLNGYVMVFVCREGWAFSTSTDLVTWSPPTLFYTAPAPLFTPGQVAEENVILVTPGNPGEVIGQTGYLLYARTPAWARVPHELWMRPFTFAKRH